MTRSCARCLVLLAVAFSWSSLAPAGEVQKRTLSIAMRDGAALATDVYMPTGSGAGKKLPTVLVCTPYDRSRGKSVDFWRDCLVRNGYVFVVQDMRGFYGSADAGRGRPRNNDGYDTVEWLARQEWSNGKVGMMGYSHLGAVQYETAVTAPPHLACAIPAQAPGNYYTDSYYPPVLRKADMETILRGAFTARTQQLLNRRIRQQEQSRVGEICTPMLHSAGWYDFFKEGAIEMFRACNRHGGEGARGRQKLLIGPWGHGVLAEQEPGEPLKLPGGLAYPANAKLDWEKDVWLAWFDHWLKGADNGEMRRPPVRYYLMGDVDDPRAPGNRWMTADDFPPPLTPATYYARADRTLSAQPPGQGEASIPFTYDPCDPVPTVGRVHPRLPVNGPFDQRPVESRADVIAFTTLRLDAPLTIVGQVRVRLWASCDRTDTDFTAKLTDVYPDGRSMIFLDSIVKGRYRSGLKEEPLAPGRAYEFNIDLGYIAIALAPGHRLRLAISSSNFDRFDINPNTGEPYGDHAVTRELLAKRLKDEGRPGRAEYDKTLVARNTIHLDKDRPTRVILPILALPAKQ